MSDTEEAIRSLLRPSSPIDPVDVLQAPREKGLYAWWFEPRSLPVPAAPYEKTEGYELLYVGIAPRKPTKSGRESVSRLRSRLRTHVRGDASRSTLRLTLGALLAENLDLEPSIARGRLTWGREGELKLTRWIEQHARISWVLHEQPWTVEDDLLKNAWLALNIDGRANDWADQLSRQRRQVRQTALLALEHAETDPRNASL